jgi:trehalose 6-phosphate synthase complex regulatory subunit
MHHLKKRPCFLIILQSSYVSLGERYGLRIVPGMNSFLVLPNNISRSNAVGAILHPGGPAHSPLSGRTSWMLADTADIDTLHSDDIGFILAVCGDEKLLRRLNDLDSAETCSTSKRGSDAKWQLDPTQSMDALWQFANVKIVPNAEADRML